MIILGLSAYPCPNHFEDIQCVISPKDYIAAVFMSQLQCSLSILDQSQIVVRISPLDPK